MVAPLKVAFFGQSGPYAPVALRRLLTASLWERAGAAFEVALVVEGKKRPMGRRDHRWLKPVGRSGPGGVLPRGQSLSELALAAAVPVFQSCDVNAPQAVKALAAVPVDVLVCVGFDRLFQAGVLGLPRLAALNAHPSDLPRLRGPAPIFWALKEGRRELAVTVHTLDALEDHGPWVAKSSFGIPELATGAEVYSLAGEVAGDLLNRTLSELQRGTMVAREQPHREATRAPRARPEDAYVDPAEWTCRDLVNFACGAPYFRAPWLRLGEDTFHIRRGLRAVEGRRLPAQFLLQGSELIVPCRDGVACLEVQTLEDQLDLSGN